MTASIAIPLFHFDTGHIIEIVRWRRGTSSQSPDRMAAYGVISRAVTSGWVQLLFNPALCLEWVEGVRDPRSWQELSEFFETAPLVKEIDENLVYFAELIEETRRHFPGLSLPRVPAIRQVGEVPEELIALAEHHPGLYALRGREPVKSPGVKRGVQRWTAGSAEFASRRKEAMAERTTGWREAIRATREEFRRNKAKGMSQSAKFEWANRAQGLSAVLASSDPGIDQRRLGELIDFTRLPACSMYLNALWRYAKAMGDKGPEDNDVDDWLQVASIAYSNFALVETRLQNHLVSGTRQMATRIWSDPVDFERVLGITDDLG